MADAEKLFPLRDASALAGKLTAFFSITRTAGEDLTRVKHHFSDASARHRFFALSMVQAILTK